MSGEAFDCSEYRIEDIACRIERMIELATCKRPPLVVEQKVYVKNLSMYGMRFPDHWQNFRSMESAENYFTRMAYTVQERGLQPDGEPKVRMKDSVTGDEIEIISYRDEHYEPDENGDIPWYPDYSERTVDELRRGVEVLKRAYVYAHSIAYLFSGDCGEESFYKMLEEDLKGLENENNKNE